jgi:Glycosyl hydrolase family 12
MRKHRYACAAGAILLAALTGCGTAQTGAGSQGAPPAAATSPAVSGVTVYGCISGGRIIDVSVTKAPACPAGDTRVQWTAQASAVPAPSTAAASTTAPSAATPASWAWCSSARSGEQTMPDSRFDLFNNEWNTSANPGPQTICGNSESNWEVTSNQRAGNTAVLTYPSVQVNYNSQNGYALSRFSSMTSSWAEQMPSVSGLDAEAAYDIWLNDLNKEVMVWVDNHGQTPAGSKVAAYSVSGATWDLYVTSDNSYMAFVREGNAASGSIDLFTLLKDLEGRGLLSSSDTLWQGNFGFEICSTGGRQASFSVTNYSLTSTPSS